MARATSEGGKGNKKFSQRDIEKAEARKQLTSVKGIAGLVGLSVLEGIGGPKARAAKGAVKISAKVARAVAKEAAGKGAKAPFGIYRKPPTSKVPRLRDTDGTPRNTTVRQKVGPKTKSGKFTEPKRKPKVNTQPPARTKPRPEAKPKFDPSGPVKATPRNLPANMRLQNVERARRAKRLAEYKAERARQAKLVAQRGEPPKKKPSSSIEYRIQFGEEKVPLGSINQTKAIADRMPNAELRRYAQLLRESTAKKPNVSPAQIAGGRNRALMSTAERRNAVLKAQRDRVIKKAKAKGMTDAQISASINRARAEAAAIARKAAK
jgi:hypothetical protein